MKKRIACLLMTLIMVVSLVPAAALTASAASNSVSEAAITVLKKMTYFRDTCYQVSNQGAMTQEFRIGYGTVCNGTGHNIGSDGNVLPGREIQHHKIGETAADKALREALKGIDQKVNSFASKNGLSLSQNQHDALVLLSFREGTAWMDGNGALKTAIINGAGANELLNVWYYRNNSQEVGMRFNEVNMYVNGVYSNVVPSNFVWVEYLPDGGVMPQYSWGVGGKYRYYFDSTKTVSHIPVPTKSGSTFLGWYSERTRNDGKPYYTWEPYLTADCANEELTALWQSAGLTPANASKNPAVLYPYYASKLASKVIYDIPDATNGKEIGEVKADVRLDRDYIGSDGTRWAHIVDTGWVIVKAGSNGVSSGGTDIDVTVTVTNSYVNSRVNATIHSAQNGSYSQGTQLRIINTDSADGFLWGQVAKSAEDDTPVGWVALMYTNWNAVKDGGISSSGSNNSKVIATATITFNGYVNVRSDAGTDNKIIGALSRNETVDVYEIKTVNGHQWGRATAGWFCLTYASVTMLTNSNSVISDAGALDYAFAGTTVAEVTPHVQASHDTDTVGKLAAGSSVTITNMVVAADKTTWGKIVWRADTDGDGQADANKSGWIQINRLATRNESGTPVAIDAARFKVINDVKIRKEASNAAEAVFTLTPGVEFEAVEIKLVGEDIWGRNSEGSSYEEWINLSSKYVTRINAPTIEDTGADPSTDLMATVVNTDSVNVRDYGSTTSGRVIGSLDRGTTVRVWEVNEDEDWYKIDTNRNGEYDYEGDGWVSVKYLELTKASSGDSATGSGSDGSAAIRTTGTGIVANTYAGVNVRSGAGIGNAAVGKLLPGTVVEILETATVGNSTWGRVAQGWVCMDYITMISYSEIPGSSVSDSSKGTAVDSLDKVEKTTTTAVYTGKAARFIRVYASPVGAKDLSKGSEYGNTTGYINEGDPVTMYELVTVTETYEEAFADGDKANKDGTPSTTETIVPDDEDTETADQNVTVVKPNEGGGTTTVTTVISYWARVNGGYIYNPEDNLKLDGLDEKVHTLTGSDTLNIRDGQTEPISQSKVIGELKKGDQVSVSALKIDNDKVWGRIETGEYENGGIGWIRLDYMSEGAYYVQQTPAVTTPTNPAPTIGSTGNTGTGGFVNNTSGYKYTGKVIRNGTTALKVRSTPSTSATETTSLDNGASLVIYETTIADGMAWGRCDAGWVYLYYVDLTPASGSAIDAKIVYTENAIVYTDSSCSAVAGTYSRMSLVDIYEVVGNMARTDMGWVNTNDIA